MRALSVLFLAALLAACSSEPPAEPKPAPRPAQQRVQVEEPTPAHLRELKGQLLGAPAGSEVEMALLVIDGRDRPQRLLGSVRLAGTGQALPFKLTFNPEVFPQGERVELRARVSQSGQLVQRLAPRRILQPESQALGQLQLERAP
ncbi:MULTISPECIES: YbaY family lipoprotein [unclassified Pseudomonas]|uniref:YbaY family lipoprotein n=1 Tax=unclassified Pseudomonas TaxID=196821 RepID=UPI001BD080BE|nr:YbaY family lipoprotein [Pseudomonas sp. Pc102]BBP81093.1 lipoprotein [Pseudomonas sp. Pc102]